ncbi:DNA methyltransferase [Methyloceanibacter sp.]|uniref:class I SAM-dependent DNA methyltransferase n=1 Tax=Methyloceanibacter sp. TaxID=1965321 RepID=UPI002D18D039|nr:DNA methyltransferase [Methyloceanibacter sp.]HML93056.1 class I SAM-dependent DNA methyltransferase [Methyloceanibacter sp.]
MEDAAASTGAQQLEDFIEKWSQSSGAERANFQSFANELCDLLDVSRPDAAKRDANDSYVFEYGVKFKSADGAESPGWVDLYKRGCFVLEAKQSRQEGRSKAIPGQQDFFSASEGKSDHRSRGRAWDVLMVNARRQAEEYAKALPASHGWPPFVLVCDVGHCIEIYADFSGQGKNYAQFPDRRGFRIFLDDLRQEEVRKRLRTIWTDPLSLDPATHAAVVSRDVAERLARIAKRLDKKHDPKDVAEFLMRCLFTMFAEDVGLLPENGFTNLLEQMKETPKHFQPALESLWEVMDKGGYAPHLNATLKRFNGALFKNRTAIALDGDDINELWVAAKRDWQDVEPAIFGTLLERALDPRDRSKLGAHYTPRAYVERLVVPTIIEPFRSDWEAAKAEAVHLNEEGDAEGARKAIRAFHHQLCTTRVLDPACGTGNFLYVSLELMKRLEGEVLEALEELGEDAPKFAMAGETVDPGQFYGLEINPRAVAIADLVLWIGYLKWQLKTGGPDAVSEPVLDAYGTIKEQDAILAYDSKELARDEDGKPISVWDGHTMKDHPVTGLPVPDPDARVESYVYKNPRPAKWPEVDFIVGNPPFIGGKDMRSELGDGYAEACWKARPHMPGGADFVMHFWDQAATILLAKKSELRRFGLITTNSITQTFSRRVIERHQSAKTSLSLVFAIPNHPWLKAADKAAVRIAMTVAEKGERVGVLAEVVKEDGLNTDTPQVSLAKRNGRISPRLKIGPALSRARPLLATEGISYRGVCVGGDGFFLSRAQAARLLNTNGSAQRVVRQIRNGRDFAQRPTDRWAIDAFGWTEEQLRSEFPQIYQHLKNSTFLSRQQSKRASYRDLWWVFMEPRSEFRESMRAMETYFVTPMTAKHRYFIRLNSNDLADQGLICISTSDLRVLSVMSSSLHNSWSLATGGRLGVGDDPRYNNSACFDPFPFPDFERLDPELTVRLSQLGERLDVFRKERLAEHKSLTMTGLYNVMERMRELEAGADVEPLSDKERDIHDMGLVTVLKEIHDQIDEAVLEAYGWFDLAPALVGKPGGTTPSLHKSEAQEQAEEELLTRLVALNQERAAEEARGTVRWLRPDYQIPKLGHKVAQPGGEQAEAELAIVTTAEKPAWPKDTLQQIMLVRDALAKADAPAGPDAISAAFAGRNTAKRRKTVKKLLETLAATGAAQVTSPKADVMRADRERIGQGTLYFIPR